MFFERRSTIIKVKDLLWHLAETGTCDLHHLQSLKFYHTKMLMITVPALVAEFDARPTGDQEVTGSTPAEVGNILPWTLIMK